MADPSDPEADLPDPDEFDPETEAGGSRLDRRSEFAAVLASQGFSDPLVLGRHRAETVLHDRRLEILDHRREHDPASVRALADSLDHDKGVVSRDLQALAGLDVVEYVETGRAKAPRLKHDHVVIEPVV